MHSAMKPDELQFSRTPLSKAQKLFVILCSSGEKKHLKIQNSRTVNILNQLSSKFVGRLYKTKSLSF